MQDLAGYATARNATIPSMRCQLTSRITAWLPVARRAPAREPPHLPL